MKFNLASLAAGILGGALLIYDHSGLVQAQSQTITPGKLYLEDTFTSRGQAVLLSADSVDRDVSTIRLKGHVETKLRPSNANMDVMVLRADEADYLKQSDEIVPRGNVRVSLEKPK